MANPNGYNVSIVRTIQSGSENSVSVFGKVDISKDGSFSVAAKTPSGGTTVYSFPPPSKEYLSTRRLSHNRISAM
jgi:outer membrane lipoprotein-sorting protein